MLPTTRPARGLGRLSKAWRRLGLLCLGCACSCGGEIPPNLPTTEAYQRNVPRMELVELIVDDPVRADKVRALYGQVEELMLKVKRQQTELVLRLAGARNKGLSDAEVRRLFSTFSRLERDSLQKYIDLQLQLRAETTEEEFARLDALK